MKNNDSFSRFNLKIVTDYQKLATVVAGLKAVGRRIVVTIGSWDLIHIGHVRYLIRAKECGDILVVGADSDRAIKLYKGPLRPIIPESERLEMLSFQECVDFATLVDDVDANGVWQYQLLHATRPDTFVAVEDSYSPEQIADIKRFCSEVEIFPRQATTSTSLKIQEVVKEHLKVFINNIDEFVKGNRA